jgi:hypothetical protein
MLNRFIILAMFVATIFLSGCISVAERENMPRTTEENKLQGLTYHLLRLAEEADTSAKKQEELSKFLADYKDLHADSTGSVIIITELTGLGQSDRVAKFIESIDGIVIHIGLVPYIECRIHPKSLRDLISDPGISGIREEVMGVTRKSK